MKIDLSQSCGHCWIFQICWHIEFSTFTATSFRIWNSSTGIPSAPLALFIVILPKAHLTSHSRMSGYRWVIYTFFEWSISRNSDLPLMVPNKSYLGWHVHDGDQIDSGKKGQRKANESLPSLGWCLGPQLMMKADLREGTDLGTSAWGLEQSPWVFICRVQKKIHFIFSVYVINPI